MSTTTYTYKATANWKFQRDFDSWAVPSDTDLWNKIKTDLATALTNEYADLMAKAGHWFKMDGVATDITGSKGYWVYTFPLPIWRVEVAGTTVVTFESDVKDASAHNSPQLWQIIQDGFMQLLAYLGDHPQIVVTLIAVGYLTWLAITLENTSTGAIQKLGQDTGSLAITLGILAVVGLAIYAVFFTRSGRKAGTKTYQLGRRAYHKARGR